MSRALRWTTAWICLVQDLALQTRRAGTIYCIQACCFYPLPTPVGPQNDFSPRLLLCWYVVPCWDTEALSSTETEQWCKRKTNQLISFFNVCFTVSILLNLACLFLDLLKIDKPVIISCWKAPFHNIECHKNMINSTTVNSPTSTEII